MVPKMDPQNCFIRGSDLCKFYSRPIDVKTKANDISDIDSGSELEEPEIPECKENVSIHFISSSTQTDYRESEAQTDPWDPPFIVHRVNEDPEVLCLKELSYGNGLPVSQLEIDYIIQSRKNKKIDVPSEKTGTYEEFMKGKKLICNQVRNEWNYKISKHSEKQYAKLKHMEIALTEELAKQSEKKEKLLKNIWTQKNYHMARMSSKLQKQLLKEINVIEQKSNSETQRFDLKMKATEETPKPAPLHSMRHRDSLNEEINYLLSKYYNNPNGLSKITDWLERKKTELYNEIPPVKVTQRSKREKLTEKAYQDLLAKKRTKMPPKLYREDFDQEESTTSSVKSEIEFEVLELPEEGIDLVTVWQQVLRGRAYQKQMLELIEKHKDTFDVLLS